MNKQPPKPIEAIYVVLGARTRYIREVLGMQQGELAKLVGLTRCSIVNFEAGKQRLMLHTIEQVAAALNTTPKNLLKGVWT